MTRWLNGIQSDSRTDFAFFGGHAKFIELPEKNDARGSLVPFEFQDLPFQPRRVFVTRDVPVGTTRGGHALKTDSQLLVRITGRIRVRLRYGDELEICVLDSSNVGLFVGPGIWFEQTYLEPESSLLVLASAPYDPTSYIRDQ